MGNLIFFELLIEMTFTALRINIMVITMCINQRYHLGRNNTI